MSSQSLAVGAETDPLLERAERHVRELITEQSALRQVATLVAREPTPDQLFAAVAEQVARVLAVPHVRLVRYEPEGSVVVGGFSEDDDEPFPTGSRWPLDSPGVTATVRQTGRPPRRGLRAGGEGASPRAPSRGEGEVGDLQGERQGEGVVTRVSQSEQGGTSW